MPHDILERELKAEGWLSESENILEVLRDNKNLKRTCEVDEAVEFGQPPSVWTEEDYLDNFGGDK